MCPALERQRLSCAGDRSSVKIGKSSSIQDGAVVVGDKAAGGVTVGNGVTIGSCIRRTLRFCYKFCWCFSFCSMPMVCRGVVHAKRPMYVGNSKSFLPSFLFSGPGAYVAGCVLEDGASVGMGARVLPGAVVGKGAFVDAGAVVPAGKVIPAGEVCPDCLVVWCSSVSCCTLRAALDWLTRREASHADG